MKRARIYTNDFNRIIAATKDFVCKDTNRIALKYIKLEFDAETQTVTAIAVDGFRLSVEHAVISDCEESFVAYVKSNIKLPSKNYAVFTLEGDDVIIRADGFVFGYQQPYPEIFEWKKAIPATDVVYQIGFNGNYLLSALQAAKVSCGNTFKHPVVLEFRSPLEPIVLRTNNEDIKMVLPIRMKQE